MSRAPSNFRQQDVARAIRAAKGAGLEIIRIEVDPKTAKIAVIIKNENGETEALSLRSAKPRAVSKT